MKTFFVIASLFVTLIASAETFLIGEGYELKRNENYAWYGYSWSKKTGRAGVKITFEREWVDEYLSRTELIIPEGMRFDKSEGKRGAIVIERAGKKTVCAYVRFFGIKETKNCDLIVDTETKILEDGVHDIEVKVLDFYFKVN